MGEEGGWERERVQAMAGRQAGREHDKMAEESSSCGGVWSDKDRGGEMEKEGGGGGRDQ